MTRKHVPRRHAMAMPRKKAIFVVSFFSWAPAMISLRLRVERGHRGGEARERRER